jgi:hypothetical protein
VICLILDGGSMAYIQYIGDGFYGDAVRVLPGHYREDLTPDELSALCDGPERFVAQTMLRQLLRRDGVTVCGRYSAKPVSDLVPAWLVTPAPKDTQKQWVTTGLHEKSILMSEYRRRFPDRETADMPGTGVLFPERLRTVVSSEGTPRDWTVTSNEDQ